MTIEQTDRVKAWRSLMHVHAKVNAAVDETLRCELGIPGSWYEALVEIAFSGGTMTMHHFAEETTLTKSGATRFVDRLQKAGLVERRLCPTDRRVWHLALTEKGKKVQRAADPHVLRAIDQQFGSHLSDEETKVMVDALGRVRASARSSNLAACPHQTRRPVTSERGA